MPSLPYLAAISSAALILASCSGVNYLKSELSGTAKPEGGISDKIPVSKTYSAPPDALRKAVLSTLEEQGYIAQQDAAGAIRTEPKVLSSGSAMVPVAYSARAFVTVDGQAVSYRARFDKKSGITQAEIGVEFIEKENELRRDFFAALDQKIGR